MKKIIFLLGVLFFTSQAQAQVQVAFFEFRNAKGEIIQLEPNGQFAHIAISYDGNWLHAYPMRGVEEVSCDFLNHLGAIAIKVMQLDDVAEITETNAQEYLGKEYDSEFSWDDTKIYCSELVGKLLAIQPEPMNFSAPIWSQKYKAKQNELGLSPDDLYRILQKRGYKSKSMNDLCTN